METPVFDIENLTPELQERVACFEANKEVYIGLQRQLVELTQETQRLNQKASELEGQASRTDASWRRLAGTGDIDQAKINEEIERAEKLRKEAQALRATVEARAGLENNLVVRVAEARIKLVSEPSVINKEHWQAKLARMLAQEGMRESLLKMFALSRALFLGSLKEHDGLLRGCNSMSERQAKTNELTWKAFGKEFETLFDGAEKDVQVPVLVTIPAAVPKEVVVNTPAALLNLRRLQAGS